MYTLLPKLDTDEAISLVQPHFDAPIDAVTLISGDGLGQLFGFRPGGAGYLLRLVTPNMKNTLVKEAYCQQHFTSPDVPTARIIHHAPHGESAYYSIAQDITGTRLDQATPDQHAAAIPSIIATLDAIHRIDVRHCEGWGLMDERGSGMSESWRGYLAKIRDEEHPNDFYGLWHHLFDDTFLERDLWEGMYDHMLDLLQYAPEERYLLHGQYGLASLKIEGDQVVAVYKWEDATYGDFIYDLAGLVLFSPEHPYEQRFRDFYTDSGRDVPYFDERLTCYLTYGGVDTLRYLAKAGDEGGYEWMKTRLTDLGLL